MYHDCRSFFGDEEKHDELIRYRHGYPRFHEINRVGVELGEVEAIGMFRAELVDDCLEHRCDDAEDIALDEICAVSVFNASIIDRS